MNAGRNVAAGDDEEVDDKNEYVHQGEVGRPLFRDLEFAIFEQQVSAEQEREADEDDGECVEAVRPHEGNEPGGDEEEQGDLEIALDDGGDIARTLSLGVPDQ